jgi:GNAT superfamily N-acetyltransferase
VRIREAGHADAASMARVHVDSWRTTYRGIVSEAYLAKLSYKRRTDAWFRMLNSPQPGEFHFVAEDDAGNIVGIASGGLERSGDPVYRGELYGIYILQEHQRRGIGRQFTLAVVDRLLLAGFQSMLVWVLADNPACGFYDRLGGQHVRTDSREMGGVTLAVVAYGWTDIRTFLTRPR